MVETDKQRFGEMLTTLMAVYRVEVSSGVLGVWFAALKGHELGAVHRAFGLHLRDPDAGRWAPTPAHVLGLIEGAPREQAQAAWVAVRAAVREQGPYRSVDLADSITAQVVRDMGGYHALCEMRTDDVPFRERDFVDRYTSYARRRITPQGSTRFAGIAELDDRRRQGLPAPQEQAPVRLGMRMPVGVGGRA